jgi:hypothetical protein
MKMAVFFHISQLSRGTLPLLYSLVPFHEITVKKTSIDIVFDDKR